MMSKHLMVSVAAIALIAGSGFANAQGTGAGSAGRESGGGASMQSAPSAGGGAMSGTSGTGGGAMQRDSGGPSGAASDTSQRADDNMKGQKSKSTNSENESNGMKAEGRDNRNRADGRNGNVHPENREGMSNNNNPTAENREGRSTERSHVTTGQAGAGARLSTDQRTRITTVIRNERIAPLTNVNFSVAVGTRVPRDVQFRPLPAEVVTIYPQWRGYNFILVGDQIVVVDPDTYEIVAVLDA
jgi:hypothetical protein